MGSDRDNAGVCSETTLPAVNHAGAPLNPRAVFFEAPPVEIGPLTSRDSTVVSGRINVKGWLFALFGGPFLGLFVVGYAASDVFGLPREVMFPLGALVAVGTIFVLMPRARCTYIGKNGIAQFTRFGKTVERRIFRFTYDSSIGVGQTRNYTNGIYTGTDFKFTFYSASTGQKMSISGRHGSQRGDPPTDNLWHFGNRAEAALSDYVLPHVLKRLDQGEPEVFRLSGGMDFEVGPRSVTITQNGQSSVIAYADLQAVTVQQGEITITEKGGKTGFLGFGKKGVFSFPYSSMPNARLFLFLLQRQVAEALRTGER